MTKTYKLFSVLLIAIVSLSSCEKETYVKYFIENNSSATIFVDGKDIIHSTDIQVTVAPNESKEITNWSKRGLQTDLFEPMSMFGNDLLVININGDTLKKDYKVLSNWQSSVDDQRKSASHEYTLKITDADF